MHPRFSKRHFSLIITGILLLTSASLVLAAWTPYTESNADTANQVSVATLDGENSYWQGFMPSGNLLEKVSIYFGRMDGEEVKVSIHDINDELVVSSQGQIADMSGGSGWEEFDFSSKGEILIEKGGRYSVKVSNISLLNRFPLPEHTVLYWPYSGDEYANGYAVMDGQHKYSNDFFFIVTGHDCSETCEWAGHECGEHILCDQWATCGTCEENETCTDVQGSSVCQLNETDGGEEPAGDDSPPADDTSTPDTSDSTDATDTADTGTSEDDTSTDTGAADEESSGTETDDETTDEEESAIDVPVLDELKQNDEVIDLIESDGLVIIEDEDFVTLFGSTVGGASVVVELGESVYLTTVDEDGTWSVDIMGEDVDDGTYDVTGYAKTEDGESETVSFFTMQKGEPEEEETEEKTIAVVSEDDGSNTAAIVLILAGAAGVLLSVFFIIKKKKSDKTDEEDMTPGEVAQKAVEDIAEGEADNNSENEEG